jgi:uncharacterized membrane protein HdeD (DUF308 family)
MGTAISEQLAVMGELPRHWWVVALRGLAAIIFGVLAFIWPGPTLAVLIVLYGAYAIVDGVLALYAAVRSGDNRWTFVIEGVIGIAAGLVAFVWPGITALALLFVIAAWAILTGIMEAIAGVRLRRAIDNEWMLIIAGLLSVVFGILLIAQPGAGALAIVWLIGVYAVVFGIALLALSWRLRGLVEDIQTVSSSAHMPRAL